MIVTDARCSEQSLPIWLLNLLLPKTCLQVLVSSLEFWLEMQKDGMRESSVPRKEFVSPWGIVDVSAGDKQDMERSACEFSLQLQLETCTLPLLHLGSQIGTHWHTHPLCCSAVTPFLSSLIWSQWVLLLGFPASSSFTPFKIWCSYEGDQPQYLESVKLFRK